MNAIWSLMKLGYFSAFLVALTACNNGGNTPGPNADPAGIYYGYISQTPESGTLVGIIDSAGNARFGKGSSPSGPDVQDLVAPVSISTSGNTFITNYTEIDEPGSGLSQGTFKGTVSTAASILATLTDSAGTSATYDLIYQSSSRLAASLLTIQGSWTFNYGSSNTAAVISFDSGGIISGTDSAGCNYSGAITILDPSVNAYEVMLSDSCLSEVLHGLLSFVPANSDTSQSKGILFYVNNSTYGFATPLQPKAQ